ncbi:hypothetical protein [Psychrobacter sanguinis]|uniref:hypothetical protein n=1 Tax=Psychrobacter sanguinis TaxID=861445 RepID=UPI00191B3F85|nr:hypothetical protein [Psychrobacter sanguinis]MCD9151522.1 hypothetical protein [Psychrobacter sanguinis]
MNTHILSEFDEIYYDLDKVSIDDVYIKNRDETEIKFDQLNFKDVKPEGINFHDYFFKPFKDTQPETYAVLSQIKEEFFYGIDRTDIPEILSDSTAFGININGIIVYLDYTPYIASDARQNEFNFPIEIIQSWLWHSAGWHIAESTYIPPLTASALPSSHNPPIGSVCPYLRKKSKEAKEKIFFLEKKFDQPFLVKYGYKGDKKHDTHFQLRALIDTRFNLLEQPKNFQLFSIINHAKKDMFFIEDEDVYSIKKLVNPAEAIDKYAAHLLSRQEGFFDFTAYGEDFQY